MSSPCPAFPNTNQISTLHLGQCADVLLILSYSEVLWTYQKERGRNSQPRSSSEACGPPSSPKLVPAASGWTSLGNHLPPCALTSAPFSKSSWTISWWPLHEAAWR